MSSMRNNALPNYRLAAAAGAVAGFHLPLPQQHTTQYATRKAPYEDTIVQYYANTTTNANDETDDDEDDGTSTNDGAGVGVSVGVGHHMTNQTTTELEDLVAARDEQIMALKKSLAASQEQVRYYKSKYENERRKYIAHVNKVTYNNGGNSGAGDAAMAASISWTNRRGGETGIITGVGTKEEDETGGVGDSGVATAVPEDSHNINVIVIGGEKGTSRKKRKTKSSSNQMIVLKATPDDDNKIPTDGTGQGNPAAGAVAAAGQQPIVKTDYLGCMTDDWDILYNELKKFKAKTGHTIVPKRYNENQRLADWVHYQRRKFASGKISDEHRDLLNAIEFVWSLKKPSWEERYQQLKAYYLEHGHSSIKRVYTDRNNAEDEGGDPLIYELALWIKEQRKQNSLLQKGKKSCMTQERIDKLNAIDFCWRGSYK